MRKLSPETNVMSLGCEYRDITRNQALPSFAFQLLSHIFWQLHLLMDWHAALRSLQSVTKRKHNRGLQMIPVKNPQALSDWGQREYIKVQRERGGDEWCGSDEVSPGRLPRGDGWAWIWLCSSSQSCSLETICKHGFLLAQCIWMIGRN